MDIFILVISFVHAMIFETPVIIKGFKKERDAVGGNGKLFLNTLLINAVCNLPLNTVIVMLAFYGNILNHEVFAKVFIVGMSKWIYIYNDWVFAVLFAVKVILKALIECRMFKFVLKDAVSSAKRCKVIIIANAVTLVAGIILWVLAIITAFTGWMF